LQHKTDDMSKSVKYSGLYSVLTGIFLAFRNFWKDLNKFPNSQLWFQVWHCTFYPDFMSVSASTLLIKQRTCPFVC